MSWLGLQLKPWPSAHPLTLNPALPPAQAAVSSALVFNYLVSLHSPHSLWLCLSSTRPERWEQDTSEGESVINDTHVAVFSSILWLRGFAQGGSCQSNLWFICDRGRRFSSSLQHHTGWGREWRVSSSCWNGVNALLSMLDFRWSKNVWFRQLRAFGQTAIVSCRPLTLGRRITMKMERRRSTR